MCFLVCVDGVGSLPEGSGALRPTERAGKSKGLPKPDVNCSCSFPAVTYRAHHSFGEVNNVTIIYSAALYFMHSDNGPM